MAKRFRAPEVHKFGGASLTDANAAHCALDIVVTRKNASPVVGVSALAGVATT